MQWYNVWMTVHFTMNLNFLAWTRAVKYTFQCKFLSSFSFLTGPVKEADRKCEYYFIVLNLLLAIPQCPSMQEFFRPHSLNKRWGLQILSLSCDKSPHPNKISDTHQSHKKLGCTGINIIVTFIPDAIQLQVCQWHLKQWQNITFDVQFITIYLMLWNLQPKSSFTHDSKLHFLMPWCIFFMWLEALKGFMYASTWSFMDVST